MKKVLLTESQVRRINEEIDKNDSIQKLIFADSSEIRFERPLNESSNNNSPYFLTPVINGKKIKDDYIKMQIKEMHTKDGVFFQPNINVNYDIRRLGIAEKLLTSFVLQGNKICLFEEKLNEEGRGLLNKLKNNNEIMVKPIKSNKKQIGFVAEKK